MGTNRSLHANETMNQGMNSTYAGAEATAQDNARISKIESEGGEDS